MKKLPAFCWNSWQTIDRLEVFLPAKISSPQKLLESFKVQGDWQGNIQLGFHGRA